MRGLLWSLMFFALAAGLSLLATDFSDAYLLIITPPYRTEISLSLALWIIFGSFFLLFWLIQALSLSASLFERVRQFCLRKQREKATSTFHDALRLLFEGRFSQSLKKFADVRAAGMFSGLAALLAARSAQRLNEPEKQKAWLDCALKDDPKLQSACLMLEAEMQIDLGNFAAALKILKHLQSVSGRHFAGLHLELRAQQAAKNWNDVLRITRLLEKRKAIQSESAITIKLKAHQENVREKRMDLAQLQAYQKQMPRQEGSAQLWQDYVQALINLQADDDAQSFIEAQLDLAWDSQLASLYGQIRGDNAKARITRAEHWLSKHPADAHLLHALGRMCLKQDLWEKAQNYLESSLTLMDSRVVHLDLARLFEAKNQTAEALSHYKIAAANSILALN